MTNWYLSQRVILALALLSLAACSDRLSLHKSDLAGPDLAEIKANFIHKWCDRGDISMEAEITVHRLMEIAGTENCLLAARLLSGKAELDLSSNQTGTPRADRITDLRPIGDLKKLQRLDLSSNGLREVVSFAPLKSLKSLRKLRIADNRLDSLDGLEQFLPELRWLDVRGNELNFFEGQSLAKFGKLEFIDLSANSFAKLPTFPKTLKSLKIVAPRKWSPDHASFEKDDAFEALIHGNLPSLKTIELAIPDFRRDAVTSELKTKFPNLELKKPGI